MSTATIPEVPAKVVDVTLHGVVVQFGFGATGEPQEGGHFHVAADKLPPAVVTWLETKVKAYLERTE